MCNNVQILLCGSIISDNESNEEDKDQESIQSNTTPDTGQYMEK